MSLSPSSGNIGVGDTVTLSCQVGSSHPPVAGYHWYKDGVAVGTERVLTLRGVRREDHGRYHCEAQNALGTGVSPAVTLHVFCECHASSAGVGRGRVSQIGVARVGWRWPVLLEIRELGCPCRRRVVAPLCPSSL